MLQYIAKAPLYFVRSGETTIGSGRLKSAGINGNWWPSSAAGYTNSTTATAYYLLFGVTNVTPSTSPYSRWDGLPLRCVGGNEP